MHILKNFSDYGIFWGVELHIRVQCLAMDRDISMVRLNPSFDTKYRFELDF